MPTEASRYVSGEYLTSHPDWHQADSPWKAAWIKRLIEESGLQPRSIAEVGCGAGGVIAALHASLPEVDCTGFDISPQARELARRHERDGLRFHLLQSEALPAGAHFDLILAVDVVEHVQDYIGFLRDLRSRCERLIVHLPLELSVSSILRPHVLTRARRDVGHIHHFNRETAVAALGEAGYHVERYRITPSGLMGRGAAAWWMRAPRRVAHWASPELAARLLGGFSLLILARPRAPELRPVDSV